MLYKDFYYITIKVRSIPFFYGKARIVALFLVHVSHSNFMYAR